MRRFSTVTLVCSLVFMLAPYPANSASAKYVPNPKNVLVEGLLAKCKPGVVGDGYDYPTSSYGSYYNWRASSPFRKGSTYTYQWSGKPRDAGPTKVSVTMGSTSATVKLVSEDRVQAYSRRNWWGCPKKFTITYKYIHDVIFYG